MIVILAIVFATVGSLWSVRRVKLDAIPDLSDPQVVIFTEWMGRSPTLVEDQVTYPIVSSLVAAPHVTDVRGFSMFGMSFVYVIFEEGTDPYWGRSRVLEYLNGIRGRLPVGADPTIGPDATGTGWVFQYALVDKSGQHALDELRTFQDFTLRYALGAVPGVAEVASVGGHQKQYQITVDPQKLKAYGVTLADVSRAVRDSNEDVGGRVLEMSGREYYVRGRGYVQGLGDLEKIVLKGVGPSGTPVRVGDVGHVRFGPDIRRGLLEWNGEGEAVGGIVVMRYGENALEVIDRVKAKINELKPSLPKGVEVEIAYDRSDLIDRSIATLKGALFEEILVVSVVITLFLLHIRSSLLPIITLPIAVALAFIPMYLLDIPSTIMSLGGIAIAIGATVDAEIVMIEAAHKKLEKPHTEEERHKLLAEAAKEVSPAIFFSLLIIAVAFLPVFTLNGQAGRLFKPMAYTKTFVMLASAILSITFAPALRDFLIRGKIYPEHRHPVSRAIIAVYKPFVYVALRKPKSTIGIGLLALMSAIPLYRKLGHEFMPPLNEGDVLYMPITMPNISIEEAKRQLQAQDRVLKSFPEVQAVFGKIGRAETATDPAPLTMVETTIRLKPEAQWRKVHVDRWWSKWPSLRSTAGRVWKDERPITWDELTSEMNKKMQFPGWTAAFTMPIKTRIDMQSTGVRTPIGVKVQGTSLDEIEKIGVALEKVIAPIPGTRSVIYERNQGGLYVDIVPRRDDLARYGLTIGDVERTIEAAVGGAPVSTTIEGRARFTINVRYPQDLRNDLDKLRRVLVPVGGGGGGGAPMGASMDGRTGAVYLDPPDDRILLAQAGGMGGMGGSSSSGPELPGAGGAGSGGGAMSDVPTGGGMSGMGGGGGLGLGSGSDPLVAPGGLALPTPSPLGGANGPSWVPLGQLADVKIVSGPPMVRDEDGLLVGYVFVDIDQASRDIGGYVNDAKQAVKDAMQKGELQLPPGYFLQWTGQYELMEQMAARMRIVVPLTLAIVILLLWFQFKNMVEVLIVLLSIPFALVGSVWLMWLLDYRISTAVWVGVIALVGLAAQTGIVMIVYIDHAYERRKAAGKIRDLDDIIWAHMEGTVLRVRPKLMTVSTMLVGLIPLLWATGSGADVMKRIAVPMIGGLITSAFLTREIIPVIYTYWRQEQVLWERLEPLDGTRLSRLRAACRTRRSSPSSWAQRRSSSRRCSPTWSCGRARESSSGRRPRPSRAAPLPPRKKTRITIKIRRRTRDALDRRFPRPRARPRRLRQEEGRTGRPARRLRRRRTGGRAPRHQGQAGRHQGRRGGLRPQGDQHQEGRGDDARLHPHDRGHLRDRGRLPRPQGEEGPAAEQAGGDRRAERRGEDLRVPVRDGDVQEQGDRRGVGTTAHGCATGLAVESRGARCYSTRGGLYGFCGS
ncbi:MAG: efflux RND transporter permease subunit [Deltaproteobacteria bacterium]|nr:efflux RND transporter permease subunit [Deltaproteobacteria bacterium]